MDVCLVNPPPHRIQEPMYDRPIYVRPALACLGATLRQAGAEVDLIDAKFERLSAADVIARVRRHRPRVVGLTAFTNEIKPAAELAAQVKRALPDTLTVVGGVHVSALPEQTLAEFPSFDVGCIGQGDHTVVELVEAAEAGRDLAEVPGLVLRAGGTPRRTATREQEPVVEDLPQPAWDLLPDARRYHLMSARGCPFACNFCMNPNGRKVRGRTTAQVIEEVEAVLRRHRPGDPINVWFDDEIFTVNRRRTHAICDAMRSVGLERRARWFAQTHVNVIDLPLLRKMKAAGCQRIGLGIESADETVLREMGKGSTVARAAEACRQAEQVGLPVETYFIIGHPGETVASAKRSIDFAVDINPQIPIFGIMVPYPGTPVSRMAAAGEGGYRIISDDWNDYNKQIGGAVEFDNLSRFELEWLQATGYLKVFLANRRYRDLGEFVWTYRRQSLTILKKWLRSTVSEPPLPR